MSWLNIGVVFGKGGLRSVWRDVQYIGLELK
jgi:hypothetical protein